MIVTRDKHDALRALLFEAQSKGAKAEGEAAQLRAENGWLRGQLERAYETIHQLRREGFDPPRPQPETQQAKPDPLPAEVRAAIRSVAPEGDALHGALTNSARTMLAAEMSAKEVADALRRGSTINPHHS